MDGGTRDLLEKQRRKASSLAWVEAISVSNFETRVAKWTWSAVSAWTALRSSWPWRIRWPYQQFGLRRKDIRKGGTLVVDGDTCDSPWVVHGGLCLRRVVWLRSKIQVPRSTDKPVPMAYRFETKRLNWWQCEPNQCS